jgi:DNA-binding PadR family transcriptional regulator
MHTHSDEETTENWMKEAQKGYIRVAVLMLLKNKPSHGYEIMKQIKDRTRGIYTPTPGGIYPILRDLEKTGYIKGDWRKLNNRNLKTYRITEQGQIILRKTVLKQAEIAKNMNNLFQEFAVNVLNIQLDTIPTPIMPCPFASFLEKERENAVGVEELEREKKDLQKRICMMREKLKVVSEELERAKGQTKPNSL